MERKNPLPKNLKIPRSSDVMEEMFNFEDTLITQEDFDFISNKIKEYVYAINEKINIQRG